MRLIRRLTAIAALLVGALLPSAAGAATLYITEYANIGAIGTSTTPWPPGPSLATQQVVVGGGSLQSDAFSSTTKAIQVICDIGCSVSVGSNPTAATTSTLLQQGVYQNFVVAPGQKIAVIANTAGNTSGGTPSGTQDVNVTQWGGVATTLGQKAMAASVPVVVASDQSNLPTNLAQVAGATVATGSGTAAGSIRVELPTNGTGVLASIGSITTSVTPGTAAANLGKAEDAIAGSGDTGVAVWCVQQSAPADTAANADYGPCQVSGGGMWIQAVPTSTAAAAITPSVTSAAGSNQVVCGAACNLFGFSVTSGASAGTVYVFNATSLPSNGAVTPVKCYQIAATSTIGVTFTPPIRLSTGATIGFGTGTNCFSLTASTTAFISGDAK